MCGSVVDVGTADFDAVADRLYSVDPAEFVAERTAAARAAGDADLARRIRGLRKPTAAAAFVNRLARADSAPLRELADLGRQLREAHEQLAGTQLRELAHRRAELIRELAGETSGLSDAVARAVEETLEAVVADPDVARLVLAGRLTSTAHADVDNWLSLPVKDIAPLGPSKKEQQAARQAHAAAERELVRAEQAAEEADALVTVLRHRLADAETRVARVAEELATARAAFERAERTVADLG
ncbi:hypothetical protein D5S19_24990 [Amycolatopsis panacis]|uniref:Uncharacterized protein n=1 Tax=Amycolatopsis panacis TaxID=2340917 RepID=A0A419HTV2_9PSEU|nr:hypothetical protein D5S19_24990 [Amycolatopsis panacis]